MKREDSLYFAWLVATVASLLSLYMSELKGIIPCKLCWYQRVCLLPLPILLYQAVHKNDSSIIRHILPLPIIGSFLSIWQVYQGHQVCETCLVQGTLPYLACIVFISITTFLLITPVKKRKKRRV